MTLLDLFSAAAGGWTLGLHRAGFTTIAACESVDWRRTLYAENNPGVRLYDDVRTLTAERLAADLGALPDVVVAALAERRFLVGDGGRKTASAASYLVEAFGDAVLPQIPEAIGRAILRTEAALAALYGETAA